MNTLTETDFLVWAKGKGLGIDPQYPDSAVLDFQGGSDARFWNVPPQPERRPCFLASLLALMGDWKTAYAWRHLGSWPGQNAADAERMNDVVEARILKGLDMPLGTADVVVFGHRELDTLITLLSRRQYLAGRSEKTCTSCRIMLGRSFKPTIMVSSTYPFAMLEGPGSGHGDGGARLQSSRRVAR